MSVKLFCNIPSKNTLVKPKALEIATWCQLLSKIDAAETCHKLVELYELFHLKLEDWIIIPQKPPPDKFAGFNIFAFVAVDLIQNSIVKPPVPNVKAELFAVEKSK